VLRGGLAAAASDAANGDGEAENGAACAAGVHRLPSVAGVPTSTGVAGVAPAAGRSWLVLFRATRKSSNVLSRERLDDAMGSRASSRALSHCP